MNLWNADIAQQLKGVFERLQRPVHLVFEPGRDLPSDALAEGRTLYEGLLGFHPLLHVSMQPHEGSFWRLRIGRQPDALPLSFEGLPSGHEFTSFVLALLQTGGHPPKIDPHLEEQLRQATLPVLNIETYYSLTCHNCPEVVQALNAMVQLHPSIRHAAIDGQVRPEVVTARNIMATPSVWVNGEPFHHGRASFEELAQHLLERFSTQTRVAQHHRTQVLVVGAGPAGLSAAVYTARKGIDVAVVGERLGGQVADTLGIENWIGVPYTEGPQLTQNLAQHLKHYEVPLHTGLRLEHLTFEAPHWRALLSNGDTWEAEQVILATGARWRSLNVPGEDLYKNKGVAYCPHCDGPLFKGKTVAVIGGGNSGVEAAIDLAGIVKEVILIEYDHQLKADQVLQNKLRSLSNVKVLMGTQTLEIQGDGQRVEGLLYRDRSTQETHQLPLHGLFIQIGLVPNTQMLEIPKNRFGEIEVDAKGKTTLPQLYAAGDASTSPYKQIVVAIGSGATAALSAFEDRMHGLSTLHP